MPFDFNEFLTLAEELAARPDDASKRTSISRAYYTAYHLAFPRAEARVGRHNRRKEPGRLQQHRDLNTSHAWCWQQFIDTNDVTCNQIGVTGDRMKKRRHAADYDKVVPDLTTEVERQILDAHQFRADLAALDPQYPSP